MTLEEFQKTVNDKWQELEEIEDRDENFDPYPSFKSFLKTNNIETFTYEDHWGEGGVYDFVDELIGIIHDHENRCFIMKDPSAVNWSSYLILKIKNE